MDNDNSCRLRTQIYNHLKRKGLNKDAKDFDFNQSGLTSLWLYLKQGNEYDGMTSEAVGRLFKQLLQDGQISSKEDKELIIKVAKAAAQFNFSNYSNSNPLKFSYSITLPSGSDQGLVKYNTFLKDLHKISDHEGYRVRYDFNSYAVFGDEACTFRGVIKEGTVVPHKDQVVTLEFVGGDFSDSKQQQINVLLDQYLDGMSDADLVKYYTYAVARNDLRSAKMYWGKLESKSNLRALLESASYHGFNPLMCAVINNQKDTVRQLLDKGMSINKLPSGKELSEWESYQFFNGFKWGGLVNRRGFAGWWGSEASWYLYKLAMVADSPAAFRELVRDNGNRSATVLDRDRWLTLRNIAERYGSKQALEMLERLKINQSARERVENVRQPVRVATAVAAMVVAGLMIAFLMAFFTGPVSWVLAIVLVAAGLGFVRPIMPDNTTLEFTEKPEESAQSSAEEGPAQGKSKPSSNLENRPQAKQSKIDQLGKGQPEQPGSQKVDPRKTFINPYAETYGENVVGQPSVTNPYADPMLGINPYAEPHGENVFDQPSSTNPYTDLNPEDPYSSESAGMRRR